MSDPHVASPGAFHILLRTSGAADFTRVGLARLARVPVQGAVLELDCAGRHLRGLVEAVVIPPGCEENCIGTVFVAES